jgi:osmotically inducible protein OsmC
MALSGQLGNAGLTAQSLEVNCTITMEKLEAGFTIVESALDLVAKIPGAAKDKFDTAANNAKAGCPISRLLNTKITLNARLEA